MPRVRFFFQIWRVMSLREKVGPIYSDPWIILSYHNLGLCIDIDHFSSDRSDETSSSNTKYSKITFLCVNREGSCLVMMWLTRAMSGPVSQAVPDFDGRSLICHLGLGWSLGIYIMGATAVRLHFVFESVFVAKFFFHITVCFGKCTD